MPSYNISFLPMVECKDGNSVLVIFPDKKVHVTFIFNKQEHLLTPFVKHELASIAIANSLLLSTYNTTNIPKKIVCRVTISDIVYDERGKATIKTAMSVSNKAGYILSEKLDVTSIMGHFLNDEYFYSTYLPCFVTNEGFSWNELVTVYKENAYRKFVKPSTQE